ncbi:glycosyltransferase [Duganella sp. S19_KUP01_CR8]|uniref:glycosyltransferase n=1 Tax=Duganella sp. S19_KUP01_CR8 TaxID=3025502 RepID=UPI002FCD6C87
MSTPRRIRLLQLVPEPLPSYRPDVAVLFGKYLPRLGIDCHIVGKSAAAAPAAADGFAAVARSAATGPRWRRELGFFRLCLGQAWAANRRDCDLIQVRDMVSIGLLTLAIARLRGIPFVYWASFLMCDGRIERSRAELAVRPSAHYYLTLAKGLIEKVWFYKVLLPCADHVFVQSEAMKQYMIARGIDGAKLTAAPMGVDTETLRPGQIVPQRLPALRDAPVIAYLGTLDRSRHLPLLLDAFALVAARRPDARLLLIGSSPTPGDLDELQAHARKIGVADQLTITGWLAPPQALALLAGSQAAVSYIPRGKLFDISSPTKLLEYLAMGVPAVGNDTPDQVQVLRDSDAGWLTTSNAPALAEALLAILADPAAARARAAAGIDYIEQQRSYRVLSARIADGYRRLLRP